MQKTNPVRPLEGGYDFMTVTIHDDSIQEKATLSTGYGWIWIEGSEFYGYILSSGRDDIPVGIEGTCTDGVRSPLSNVIVTGKMRSEQHVAFSIALN